MRSIGYFITSLCVGSGLACGTAWGLSLSGATVPVVDQSEPTFNQAVHDALGEVCVKWTGNVEILSEKKPQSLLSHASQYLASYRYQASSNVAQPWVLEVEFDEDVLKKAFAENGIPVWSMTRPVVLVWVVDGSSLLSGVTNPQFDSLRVEADRLNVPVVFPAGDLDDTLMQGAAAVAISDDQLRLAMHRYGADAVLAGTVESHGTGIPSVIWHWISDTQAHNFTWTTSHMELTAAYATGFDRAIRQVAGLAIHSQGAAQTTRVATVALRVTGIGALADYAQVMSIIQNLPGVKGVVIDGSAGDELALSVSVVGGRDALLQDLSTTTALTRQMEEVSDEGDILAVTAESPLRYRYGDGTIAADNGASTPDESETVAMTGSAPEEDVPAVPGRLNREQSTAGATALQPEADIEQEATTTD